MANPPQLQDSSSSPPENRRSFITVFAAIITGAGATLTPLLAGLVAFFTPLLRKSKSPQVRVALLSQVPGDGIPRYFPVVADREDAWNRYPQQRVGAVYLLRSGEAADPIAYTAKCPHAGCQIGYQSGDNLFKCPCHTSSFNLDGSRSRGDEEVSPRDMDRLPVELRNVELDGGESVTEVWVEYIDFQTGHKEQHRTA
ncbi:MAG: Rieske 2Fe-2S domain-containing protein [Planctomycetales bacterium]|nr:Rieske 2Fe-2S domain-containing protein [Planctomycetales bacterium]